MPGTTITVNWIDWITLTFVLVSILRAARHGALAGLLDLVVLIAAFFAASALYARGASLLHGTPVLPPPWVGLLSFLVIWLGLYIPIGILIRWILSGRASPASRTVSGLLGGVRGLVITAALLVLALASPVHGVVQVDAGRSRVAPYLLRAYERISTAFLPLLPVRVPRLGPGGSMF